MLIEHVSLYQPMKMCQRQVENNYMATLRFGEIAVTIVKGNAYADFLIDLGGNFGLTFQL